MNISIRPLIEEDAYISYKWRNDSEVFKYTGNTYKNEITLESELQWIREVINRKDEYRCAILVENNYVGNIYLTDINNDSAIYHIFIGNRAYWGKGVAKIASGLIIDYAFNILNIRTIYLRVHRNNHRALSLYKSLGFKYVSEDKNFYKMNLVNSKNKET